MDKLVDGEINICLFATKDGNTMRILKATQRNIAIASDIVRKGGLVVYPTDTVYGLGCDPLNIEAVKKTFHVKGDREKPLPILASSIENVEKIAHLSESAERIAARFWPGPLTLVLIKKSLLPNVVTCNQSSVGVRIPKHDVAIRLIQMSGGLLVGTSANKTGKKPPQNAREAAEQIGEEIDLILDSGTTSFGVSSTLVDLTSTEPKLLREGPISLKEILDAL